MSQLQPNSIIYIYINYIKGYGWHNWQNMEYGWPRSGTVFRICPVMQTAFYQGLGKYVLLKTCESSKSVIPKALYTTVLAWMLVHPSGLRPEEGWWSRRTRGPCAVGPRPTPPPPDEAKRCHVALLHRHFSTLLKNPTSTSMQLSSRGTCCVSSLG